MRSRTQAGRADPHDRLHVGATLPPKRLAFLLEGGRGEAEGVVWAAPS